ncbi:MAG: NADH-quinone oxidoreductase subunit N [bacterium]
MTNLIPLDANAINALRTSVSWTIPELMVLFGAITILAIEALAGPRLRKSTEPIVALLTTGFAFLTNLLLHANSAPFDIHDYAFNGMIAIDAVTGILRAIILATLFIGFLFTLRHQIWNGIRSEYYSLAMFAAVGAILMVEASHLIVLVLGLEILSLPLYTLAALRKRDSRSKEAALKYFVLGSLASAVLIFGLMLIYGGAGSIDYRQLYQPQLNPALYTIGALFVLVGLLFKGGLMPFYVWSPDVYEGAPDAVVGLMAALAKVGAFGALIRLAGPFVTAIPGVLLSSLAIVAGLTMLFGNLLALAQNNLKRLLAYSSVAHAGYLLLGILAATKANTLSLGLSAVLFYLGTYLLTIVAAFALIAHLQGRDGHWTIDDLEGAGNRHPGFAFTLTVLLLSLGGIPPLAGFFGKAYIFHAAMGAGLEGWAVFGVLTSVMSVYYYLRVIVAMYFKPEKVPLVLDTTGGAPRLASNLVVLYLFLLGLVPGLFYGPAWQASRWEGRGRPFPEARGPNAAVESAVKAIYGPK